MSRFGQVCEVWHSRVNLGRVGKFGNGWKWCDNLGEMCEIVGKSVKTCEIVDDMGENWVKLWVKLWVNG